MLQLVGTGSLPACNEIHIFLGPLGDGIAEKYKAAVKEWNATVLPKCPIKRAEMKAPVLTLIFRDGQGEQPVTVCQSAGYIFCDNVATVQEQCDQDAAYFESKGFQVLRKKIEATAYGIKGIPQTAQDVKYGVGWSDLSHEDQQLRLYDNYWKQVFLGQVGYFEFHLKVQHRNAQGEPQPITDQEESALRALSDKLSHDLQVPIPLSYNREKNENNFDNGGCQRFLNVRFYNLGMEEIKPKLEVISDAIKASGQFQLIKTISEYVWYDSYKQMDHGWIDYSPEELAALQARLAKQ